MRNAFVVLVSLCIGVVSGFVVPKSVSELNNNTTKFNDTIAENKNETTTSIPSRLSVLPKSRNDIDEKELYEHATEKQNNQSERAFIYINQIYKKPVRNKIFKMLPLDKPELVRIVVTPPPASPPVPQTPCPSTFDSLTNSYFQGYDFPDKPPQDMASYFAAPSIFRCNFKDKTKISADNSRNKAQSQAPNKIDERRDYFELLKPPILRPVSRVNTKASYDIASQNDFGSLAPSNMPYKDSLLKKYNLKNQYLSKANIAVIRQDDFKKNYGFHSEFIRRPALPTNKDLSNRVEDVNFEGDFINEDDTHRLLDQEEDKLLDKYLKDTLEEQITGTDKGNMPECSYRECILQTSKQFTNNGLLIKPDCKCGKRHNIKQVDPFAKDRPLREETKRNETLSKSTEMNYYEDVLSGETAIMRQDEDVVRPPYRYNDTSRV
uniref:Uncharacterized protein n=1 Tax=Heliothis virescens TaxID=7102 RepID=A0A2A4J2S8_HELVI